MAATAARRSARSAGPGASNSVRAEAIWRLARVMRCSMAASETRQAPWNASSARSRSRKYRSRAPNAWGRAPVSAASIQATSVISGLCGGDLAGRHVVPGQEQPQRADLVGAPRVGLAQVAGDADRL